MEKLSSKVSAFLAGISAVLTALSQITEGWYLAAFSLMPLIFCLLYTKGRQTVKAVWIFFLVYHGILCAFLTTLYDYLEIPALLSLLLCISAVVALSLLLSLIMFIAVYPSVRLNSQSALLRVTAFAACFSLGQWFTEIMPILSFPWAKLENAFAYQPLLLQSAALLGGNFTAFLIVLFNGLSVCVMISLLKENVALTLKYSAALSLLFSAMLCGSALYMLNKEEGEYVTVAAVQGSAEGILKSSQSSEQTLLEYAQLIDSLPDVDYDVILLPETAVSSVLTDEYSSILAGSANDPSAIVTGCIYVDDRGLRYNALQALGNSKTVHLKQVLVPIGEYVPFFKISGFSSLTPAKNGDSLAVGGRRYAAAICIESIYSSLLSSQIDSGCDMILISTNDSWFKNSYARELHFRHCVIRAVEYDRYTLRSGNCGISALIDRSGNIVSAQYGKEAASVIARAQLLKTKTPYSIFGNVFQLPALLSVCSFYLLSLMRKITSGKA